jgi:hypothetical protein
MVRFVRPTSQKLDCIFDSDLVCDTSREKNKRDGMYAALFFDGKTTKQFKIKNKTMTMTLEIYA